MIRLLFNILLATVICKSAHAEEISLSFYNRENIRIADVFINLDQNCDSSKMSCTGYWRGLTDSNYLTLDSRGHVTAGIRLHNPAGNNLVYITPPSKDKKTYIHLGPPSIVQDEIVIFTTDLKKLNSGEWVYATDGGHVDQGTFKSK